MGIKITYKKKTPLSNEPQTTLKSAGKEQGKTKQDDTANQGPVPFIDKISVVMDVPANMAPDSYAGMMSQTAKPRNPSSMSRPTVMESQRGISHRFSKSNSMRVRELFRGERISISCN